jgi:hypothetical protein
MRSLRRWLGLVAALIVMVATTRTTLTVNAAPATSVPAAKSGTCSGFAVTVGGRTFSGNQQRTIPASQVTSGIAVLGKYVRFNVNQTTFAVTNYTLTGANSGDPRKDLPIDAPVVVFKSKVPNHRDTLNSPVSLTIGNESVVITRKGTRQSIKIQAKDCAQGGLFQMEPEPAVTQTNTLGDTFRYTNVPAGATRLCFTNGAFSGYDSPELANLVSRTTKVATWRVQAGGRIGMVVGEDAVQGGCKP